MLRYGVIASIINAALTKEYRNQIDFINATLNINEITYKNDSEASKILSCKAEPPVSMVVKIEQTTIKEYSCFLNSLVERIDPSKQTKLVSAIIQIIDPKIFPKHSFGFGSKTKIEFCSQKSIILTEFLAEVLYHCVVKETNKRNNIEFKNLGTDLLNNAPDIRIDITEKNRLNFLMDNAIFTSDLEDSFNAVFEEITKKDTLSHPANSILNVYSLRVQCGEFDYRSLIRLCGKGIDKYVLTQMESKTLIENGNHNQSALVALNKMKKNGFSQREFLGYLVFLFMENALKAPKLFNRIELVRGDKIVIDEHCDGVYLLPGKENNQLVFGTSDIQDNLDSSLDRVIDYAKAIRESKSAILSVAENFKSKIVDEYTARIIQEIIRPGGLSNPKNSFGIIVGYTPILNEKEILEKGYDNTYYEQIKKDLTSLIPSFCEKLKNNRLLDYSFNLYLIPFKHASEDIAKFQKMFEEGDFYDFY